MTVTSVVGLVFLSPQHPLTSYWNKFQHCHLSGTGAT